MSYASTQASLLYDESSGFSSQHRWAVYQCGRNIRVQGTTDSEHEVGCMRGYGDTPVMWEAKHVGHLG